jgi:hypothetical protein
MGQELDCRMHYRNQTLAGKAYQETDHNIIRGDQRVKKNLKELK